jgi:hypothetical protein
MKPHETAAAAELLLEHSATLLGGGDELKNFVAEMSPLVPIARGEGDDATSAANKIVELAARHETTRTWMKHYSDFGTAPDAGTIRTAGVAGGAAALPEAVRGYEGLPGIMGAILPQVYVCPIGGEMWYRPSVGSPIPKCKKHGVTFVPAKAKS